MAKRDPITAAQLRDFATYDPETGHFFHKNEWPNIPRGTKCGSWTHKLGYVYIRISGKKYFAHRLAFLYMTGKWPAEFVDHINCCRTDNRWANLREANRQINGQNRRFAAKNKKNGLPLGVFRYGKTTGARGAKPYYAAISVNKVRRIISFHDTPEEAHEAYVQEKRLVHEGCTI